MISDAREVISNARGTICAACEIVLSARELVSNAFDVVSNACEIVSNAREIISNACEMAFAACGITSIAKISSIMRIGRLGGKNPAARCAPRVKPGPCCAEYADCAGSVQAPVAVNVIAARDQWRRTLAREVI
jgi:hypothetical protein